MKKRTWNKLIRDEKGQALIIVMILMLFGGLIIVPMLAYMSTGMKVGKEVYEERMSLFYAADSGAEDALWQIKYEKLTDLFGASYDPYDYTTTWGYDLPQDVNDKDVDVTIENVWIPDIPIPADPEQIIEQGKLIITGSIPEASRYKIKIIYYYDNDEDPGGANLKVETIGIWLPPGFDYEGSCSLADDPHTVDYAEPDVDDYCSGKAVVWDFASVVSLNDFPGAEGAGSPMVRSFTFQFSGPAGQNPGAALSWIDSLGLEAAGIDCAWDADTKIFKITSTATDAATGKKTKVETYTARLEMRELGSALSGDYCAIGASLMTATGSIYYRDRLFKENSATIQSSDPAEPGYIPLGAHVDNAFLYWSGWIEESGGEIAWEDVCDNMEDWIPGSDWSLYGWGDTEFRGHHSGGGEGNRYLTLNAQPTGSLDLSEYSGETVEVSWEQRESGSLEESGLNRDCLQFQFYKAGVWGDPITAFCGDNPDSSFSYPIPDEYLTGDFKIRFYLYGFNETGWGWDGTEYCYIDDIKISVVEPLVESAKVNRVIFNGNQITTNQWQVEPTPDSGAPDSWSYSCFKDVTGIVQAELESDMSGTFTLGHWLEDGEVEYDLYLPGGGIAGTTGYPLSTPALCTGWGCSRYQWTYAGWSLIVIYSSPETRGHQLYLFDEFHYIAPHTEGLRFAISGFLVPEPIEDEEYAAHLTCFVGDGDDHYSGDFIALNAPTGLDGDQIPDTYKLWDGIITSGNSESSPNNVWNSQSIGLTGSGVDVDTFNVLWTRDLLEPGDTAAEVILSNASSNPSDAELINFVYIIISFRSSITSGGTISYSWSGG